MRKIEMLLFSIPYWHRYVFKYNKSTYYRCFCCVTTSASG